MLPAQMVCTVQPNSGLEDPATSIQIDAVQHLLLVYLQAELTLTILVCFQMRNMEVGDRRGSTEAVGDLALTACCRRKALLA